MKEGKFKQKWPVRVDVETWEASGLPRKFVGHLLVNRNEDTGRYYAHFVFKDTETKFGGALGWDALVRAMQGKPPIIGVGVVKDADVTVTPKK